MGNGNELYEEALSLCRCDPPNFGGAYEALTKASENGDDRATYALATWFLFGNEVVAKDEARGVAILKGLAGSYVAEAVFDLAVAYDLGRFVEQDDSVAFSLYMRAGLLGEREACSQVSQYYAEGSVVEHDDALANAWRKRSEQEERDIAPAYRLWLDREDDSAER